MERTPLRKFLIDKRVELYERVNDLKDVILSEHFKERDVTNLEVAEAELNLIKEVITICENRGKF